MDLSTLIQRIRNKYANQSTQVFTDSVVTDFINDALGAISVLEGMSEEQKTVYPFSAIHTESSPGTSFTLPDDFIRAYRVYSDSLDADIYPISPADIEDFSMSDSSRTYYYIVGNTMYFTKSVTGDVDLYYYKIHATLVNGTDELDPFLNGYERVVENHVMSQIKLSDDADRDNETYYKKYIIGITDILGRALKVYGPRVGIDQISAASPFTLSSIRTRIRNKYQGPVEYNNAYLDELVNEALRAMSTLEGVPGVHDYYPLSATYSDSITTDVTAIALPSQLIRIRKIRSESLDSDIYPYNPENEDNIDFDSIDTVFYYVEEGNINFTSTIESGDTITVHYFKYHDLMDDDGDTIDEFFRPYAAMIDDYVLSVLYSNDLTRCNYYRSRFTARLNEMNSKVRTMYVGAPSWSLLDTYTYWSNM